MRPKLYIFNNVDSQGDPKVEDIRGENEAGDVILTKSHCTLRYISQEMCVIITQYYPSQNSPKIPKTKNPKSDNWYAGRKEKHRRSQKSLISAQFSKMVMMPTNERSRRK